MSVYNFKARIAAELFYNYESHWGVYAFITSDPIPHLKKGKVEHKYNALFGLDETEEGYLVGQMQKLEPGMSYAVKAEIKTHPKYGHQYVPLQVELDRPSSREDNIIFLKSFCTKRQAEEIVDKYPKFIDDVLDGELNFSLSLKPNKLADLIAFINENYASSNIMIMLSPLGVTWKTITKLIDDQPNTQLLMQTLEENPYVLTKVHGLGFKKVDDIALKVNPDLLTSKHRMKALIRFVIQDSANGEGHTILPLSKVRIEANNVTPECVEYFDELIEDPDFITKSGSMVGLTSNYYNESYIYNRVQELSKNCNVKAPEGYDIAKTEEKLGITFTDAQREAILSANTSDFVIISGSAGTGKTTVIRGILDMFHKSNIAMCALAAKAAQRMSEVTDHPASTMHRLLRWNGDAFKFNEFNKLPTDIVILDEASMVNLFLFRKLIEAINVGKTKFIIVFDHAQLPPIGSGNVAADLLKDPSLTVNKFTKIHRQAAKSGILLDANTIRKGQNPIKRAMDQTRGDLKDMHYKFVQGNKEEKKIAIQQNLVRSFFLASERYEMSNVVIILPRKKNALNSTTEINQIIHTRLFDEFVPHMKSGKRLFAQGARIIQRVNNYELGVVNGEVGIIEEIETDGKHFHVRFTPEKKIKYERSLLKEIDLAYALTVHSYQGSQSDVVIIGLDFSHYVLLDNCLLYTAITRAAKQCKIITDYKAFTFAISKNKNLARKTYMSKMIDHQIEPYKDEKKNKKESKPRKAVPNK